MEVTGRLAQSIAITAGDESQLGSARRQALNLASALDFDELHCGQLGIAVTEAARNLSSHGGGGELVLMPWQLGESAGIDVLALDKGPGIADIGLAMQDGYSTGSTPGTGLGALARLASEFQIYSGRTGGTAVLARMVRSATAPLPSIRLGAVALPYGMETVSGDGWAALLEPGRSVYLMADGLGHGPAASLAQKAALASFMRSAHKPTKEILMAAHGALQATRGAAVAVAEIDHERGLLRYAGSGNIAAQIVTGATARSLVSMNGTPGHSMGTLQEFSYPFAAGSLLVMHSDGLATRWSLTDYPGLATRHPALIAGVLFRDYSRRRDDATVLVAG